MIGWLFSLLTFPGVMLHEFSHKKFCDWFSIRVFKVRYFRLGNPVGFVEHAHPEKYRQIFWISFGPLLINSLCAFVTGYGAFHGKTDEIVRVFLVWVSFSLGANAFPSDHDMQNIIEASKNPLRFSDFITLGFIPRYLSLLFVFPMKWISDMKYLEMLYALFVIALGAW